MVFSSIPPYLDPPNWQQANTQPVGGGGGGGGGGSSSSSHFSVPTPPLAAAAPPTTGYNGAGSIRPGSMAEQARIANIPMPEAALKCPRCDSTNTKFCYYNNYNLNQPRYLCKACKRYWTKGGTRRNVPVGGGSRRNKRSSSTKSKSTVDSSGPSGGSGGGGGVGGGGALLGLLSPQIHHPLRFMAPSSSSQRGHHEFIHGDVGLQYNIGISNHFNLGVEPWRFQTSNSLVGFRHGMTSSSTTTPWARETHQSSVSGVLETFPLIQGNDHKLKESHDDQELNLSRQILVIHGNDQNNHQFNTNWESANGGSTSSWTDLSGFSSSSTTTTNPHL